MRRTPALRPGRLAWWRRSAASPTVVAPTFDELVLRAESVIVARVVATRSAWVNSRAGRAIVTDVTVSIERTLKGPTYAERSFEFLGGTVGDDTLAVAGMPEFHVGDRDVLFISEAGRPASPLVGFMYGRFRIIPDPRTGADMVRTHDGRPLASTDEVGNVRPPAFVAPPRTLSLAEFVRAIGDKVRVRRSDDRAMMTRARCAGRGWPRADVVRLARALSSYALLSDRWPDGTVTMQLQLGSPSRPLSDGSTSYGPVAESALGEWNQNISRVQFNVVRDSDGPKATATASTTCSSRTTSTAWPSRARRWRSRRTGCGATCARKATSSSTRVSTGIRIAAPFGGARTTSAAWRCTSSGTCSASITPTTTARTCRRS